MAESEHERRHRQMQELLQELRVALPGVQVLFAFLLVVPFSDGFDDTTAFQRQVYLATLIAAALSTALLIAPTAFHRLRFEQGDKPVLIEVGTWLAIMGLLALAAALTGVVLLVTDYVFSRGTAVAMTAGTGATFLGLWFVLPLARYLR